MYKSSLVKKMLLSYVTIILLAIMLLGSFTYYNNVEVLEKKTSEHALSTLQLISEKIDAYIYKLEQVSIIIYQENLQEFLSYYDYKDELVKFQREARFKDIFDKHLAFLNFSGEIQDISFIYNDGNVLHKGNGIIDYNYNFSSQEWYQKTVNAKGYPVLTGPHKQPYMMNSIAKARYLTAGDIGNYYITYSRIVNGIYASDKIGVLMIDFGLREIEKILSQLKLGDNSKVYIVDDEDRIIYDINKELTGNKLDSKIAGQVSFNSYGKYNTEINNEKVLVTYYSSESTGWKFININPVRVIASETGAIQKVFVYVAFISFIITAVMSVLFSYAIINPLRKLKKIMKSVTEGDLSAEAEVRSGDETGQLAESFNTMISRIRYLINEVYRTQLKEKEAQLNALQSQINPHFLYNTLESINCIAIVNEVKEISIISRSLAEMFRYSIKQGYILVEIEEELKHVNNYINIQKIRFGNKIDFEFNISEDVLKLKTIRLIMQPVIENSIHHGLELKRGGGKVIITIQRKQDYVEIVIEDNGIGIDSDKLVEIRKRLKGADSEDKQNNNEHIGIYNVNSRLQFYFGKEYGLQLDSIKSSWTRATICIPITL